MVRINITEAKNHLSKYLRRVKKGETIILCERNVPFAEIGPIKPESRQLRPIGLDKGRFIVPENINDPLPDWLLDAFEGKKSE
ncbi:MAG TPA: type II toxin-antitoxin system prevent-host-death family antitoxin [Candidatus Binatus sp.]|uniref:type II toxin-antitoxin system Phd/YefM family antitoxin n=1 Tax=Candidatus Binatus sp. TaxID=2811406 RepID=UPI002F42C0C6